MPYLIGGRNEQSVKARNKLIFSPLYIKTVYPGPVGGRHPPKGPTCRKTAQTTRYYQTHSPVLPNTYLRLPPRPAAFHQRKPGCRHPEPIG